MRVRQLEEEIEMIKEKSSQEIEETQKKNEEAYALLKHYSELEKEQW